MHECTKAEYIEKLPKGKHSTKGIGRTYPDPKKSKILEDTVEVPLGVPVEDSKVKSDLLYNEYPFLCSNFLRYFCGFSLTIFLRYIVYDVAQVHVKYLLNVNFKYKY